MNTFFNHRKLIALATALTLLISCGEEVELGSLHQRGGVYVVPETQKPYSGKYTDAKPYSDKAPDITVKETGTLKNGKRHGKVEFYHGSTRLAAINYKNGVAFFKDPRDGKTYKTVVIGWRIWMAENLNFEAKGSKCYENDESNCQKYGRLYDWATAMAIDAKYNEEDYFAEKTQGVCPKGWHLPSKEEWDEIAGSSGKKNDLKAKSGWNDYGRSPNNGTDDYGFSALPGGFGKPDGSFEVVGGAGRWWSATQYNNFYAYGGMISSYELSLYNYPKDELYSIRCICEDEEKATKDAIAEQLKADSIAKAKADSIAKVQADEKLAAERTAKLAKLAPAGYKVIEEIKGDLNKDGLEDYVLIIKGTKKDKDCRAGFGETDCYHRGLMVVFSKGDSYEPVLEKRDFLESDNQYGGAYFPPQLSVSIKNGNLYIDYDHGKYGNWSNAFRYQNSDFELIGYDGVDGIAGVFQGAVSINFLTKKLQTRTQIEPDSVIGIDEFASSADKLKETWENFTFKGPIKLRKIAYFGKFNAWDYVKVGSSFTDGRDGKKYRTVKIGEQTWMAENLNYKTDNSKCYDNKEANCKKYWRLYSWDEAKKACPAGWHLPGDGEWQTLVDFAGGDEVAGEKLKAKSGWNDNEGMSGNGTDDYGFSALPGGLGLSDGSFDNVGNFGNWWSSEEEDANYAYGRGIYHNNANVSRYYYGKTLYNSIRCIK